MCEDVETVRVQLNYPLELVREPILYRLVVDFGLKPSIRKANFSQVTGGFIFVEISGPKDALDRGLRWLEEVGITISAIGVDGTQEWAV